MIRDLEILERHLGIMFMPGFATSIVNKQLQDIGASRDTYDRDILNELLKQIEDKVLKSFKGDDAPKVMAKIKKEILEEG